MKPLSEIITTYYQQHRALPSYNFNDCWDLQAMCDAVAGNMSQPLLVMTYKPVVDALGMDCCVAMVNVMRQRYNNQIFLHLDHCDDITRCIAAVDAGYHSVMFDGSALSLEENIRGTHEVVKYAHKKGVIVEAEIGRIRGRDVDENEDYLAQVEYVVELAQKTDVDMIAVGVGTAHGFYQGQPEIHFDRLKSIYQATQTPLVLHGGTGISADDLRKSIEYGVVKINVGTALHTAYMTALSRALVDDGASAYPPITIPKAMKEVTQQATAYAEMIAGH